MKKALHIIYNILLYLFLILGIVSILRSGYSGYRIKGINCLALGYILYVISGVLIIRELLYSATVCKPDSGNARRFYITSWVINFIADFIFTFFISGFGRVLNRELLLALYAAAILAINYKLYNKTDSIKINKVLLWAVIIIMFALGMCMCLFVDLKLYDR